MDEATRARLLQLNRDFYEREADAFGATRDHPWPGWQRVLQALPTKTEPLRVLDAGCGNGRFAVCLDDAYPGRLDYVGVDASPALLAAAARRARGGGKDRTFRFVRADLVEGPDAIPRGPFDLVVLFGVLHHVPGFETRVRLVARLAERLAEGGRLAATIWRFGADPRVRGRTVPIPSRLTEIAPESLEPGDELLRWGDSDEVVRYCHFADDCEIDRLLERVRASGLALEARFRSDGRGDALNEYLVWWKPGGPA